MIRYSGFSLAARRRLARLHRVKDGEDVKTDEPVIVVKPVNLGPMVINKTREQNHE